METVRYLDYNATAPLCREAREAWLEAVERWPGNPSSPHRVGGRAERALELAREEMASLLGCGAEELIWTSGATESINAAVHHLSGTIAGELWVSAIEHPCLRAAAGRWFAGRCRVLPVDGSGVIDGEWVERSWRETPPGAVAVMAANNETGVLQPWETMAARCRDEGVPFLCDAAQWLGKQPAAGLGLCDYVAGCAHKFGGVPGVGWLKVARGFRGYLVGGPQEEGRRAGTENVPGVVASVAALRAREAWLRDPVNGNRAEARDAFEARLREASGGVGILGADVPRLWNTSAVLMPPGDCRRRWVVRLDREGFAVSTGSACSSGQEKPSHVLAAMGLDGSGERMIRVSGGWETEAGDWTALAGTLAGWLREGVGRVE